MKRKKFLALILTLTLVFTMAACGTTEDANAGVNTPAPTKEAVPTTAPTTIPADVAEPTAAPTEAPAPAAKTVSPLPVTIDMNNLTDCTVAVSFNKGDAYVDDNGAMQLKVKVYTYDLYDMVDIAVLTPGDTIILRGEEVLITDLVRTDSGAVQINGGLDAGGYELRTDEHTVYYEIGYSDVKTYFELGEATLPVSENFILTDNADPEGTAKTFHFEDLSTDNVAYIYGFDPNNTRIVIEGGAVTQMERVYTP